MVSTDLKLLTERRDWPLRMIGHNNEPPRIALAYNLLLLMPMFGPQIHLENDA